MGLDDLGTLQFFLPMLAFLLTLIISGPATLLSYGAWKWSLSRLANGRSVRASRVASLLALVLTGLPTAYTLALMVSLLGPWGVLGLLLVLALALLALVHAAFRDESIREMGADPELAENLARLPEVSDRQAWLRDAGRAALPSFAGATKSQTLKRAATVALFWLVPFAFIFLASR